jgi:hypothetical protein
MNMRRGILRRLRIPALCGAAGLFLACADAVDDASLRLPDSFRGVYYGDTTEAVTAVKKARDASGRMRTDDAYTDFYLVSEDTNIARVFEQRRIIGVKAGSTMVSARDEKSSLASPQYDFTVSCVISCK